MQKELVRVYDKNKKPFSEYVDRNTLPKKGFYFNLVNIWIVDTKKNILIQKRSKNKILFPNLYECVAGAVIEDETILDAAIREVKEELNFSLLPNQFHQILVNNDHKICYFMTTYIVKLDNIDLNSIKFNKEEIDNIKLVSLEELSNMIENNLFTEDIKKRFKKIKPFIKKYSE